MLLGPSSDIPPGRGEIGQNDLAGGASADTLSPTVFPSRSEIIPFRQNRVVSRGPEGQEVECFGRSLTNFSVNQTATSVAERRTSPQKGHGSGKRPSQNVLKPRQGEKGPSDRCKTHQIDRGAARGGNALQGAPHQDLPVVAPQMRFPWRPPSILGVVSGREEYSPILVDSAQGRPAGERTKMTIRRTFSPQRLVTEVSFPGGLPPFSETPLPAPAIPPCRTVSLMTL